MVALQWLHCSFRTAVLALLLLHRSGRKVAVAHELEFQARHRGKQMSNSNHNTPRPIGAKPDVPETNSANSVALQTGAASATQQFGPQLQFEPILKLDEKAYLPANWYRIHPVWRTDKGELLPLQQVLGLEQNRDLFFGFTTYCFEKIRDNLDKMDSILRDRIRLTLTLPSGEPIKGSTLDLLHNFAYLTGLPAHQLVIEIEEKLLPQESERLASMLIRLRIKGLRIAICGLPDSHELLQKLDSLPVNDIVLDLGGSPTDAEQLSSSETESGLARLVDFAREKQIATSVRNVSSNHQLELIRKYRITYASGTALKPMLSNLLAVHKPA